MADMTIGAINAREKKCKQFQAFVLGVLGYTTDDVDGLKPPIVE
jgi:hypothetical protein